jgi:hypothetical protein
MIQILLPTLSTFVNLPAIRARPPAFSAVRIMCDEHLRVVACTAVRFVCCEVDEFAVVNRQQQIIVSLVTFRVRDRCSKFHCT